MLHGLWRGADMVTVEDIQVTKAALLYMVEQARDNAAIDAQRWKRREREAQAKYFEAKESEQRLSKELAKLKGDV